MKGITRKFTIIIILVLSLAYAGSTAAQFTEIKIIASDPLSTVFGKSVSISGDAAIVGAPEDAHAGNSSGAAFLFVRNGGTWTKAAKLTASDAAENDRFGKSVSISGNTAIVGSFLDDDAGFGSASGSAYLFQDTSAAGDWSSFTETKIAASDAGAGDQFGFSVSISGNTAIVGAPLDDSGIGFDSGSAYLFQDTSVAGNWSSITHQDHRERRRAARRFWLVRLYQRGHGRYRECTR